MLTIAVVLNLVVAAGLCALAAKYAVGPVPAKHHAQIFDQTALPVGDGLITVLTTLKVARDTGVQTPWKPALALSLLGVVAFGLSVT
jgi:hypothetical protein